MGHVTVRARGLCSMCDRSYRVDDRGRMQQHPNPPDPRAIVQLPGYCPGSSKPPKEGPR